jgi:hypothetical protein
MSSYALYIWTPKQHLLVLQISQKGLGGARASVLYDSTSFQLDRALPKIWQTSCQIAFGRKLFHNIAKL